MKFSSRIIDDYVISISNLGQGNWSLLYEDPINGEMAHRSGHSAEELLKHLRDLVRSSLHDISVSRYTSDLSSAFQRVFPFFDTQPNGTLLWCNKVDTNAFMSMRKLGKTEVRVSVAIWRGQWAFADAKVEYSNVCDIRAVIDRLESSLRYHNGKPARIPVAQSAHEDGDYSGRRHNHYHGAPAPMDAAARSRIRSKLGISEGILTRYPQHNDDSTTTTANTTDDAHRTDEEASI